MTGMRHARARASSTPLPRRAHSHASERGARKREPTSTHGWRPLCADGQDGPTVRRAVWRPQEHRRACAARRGRRAQAQLGRALAHAQPAAALSLSPPLVSSTHPPASRPLLAGPYRAAQRCLLRQVQRDPPPSPPRRPGGLHRLGARRARPHVRHAGRPATLRHPHNDPVPSTRPREGRIFTALAAPEPRAMALVGPLAPSCVSPRSHPRPPPRCAGRRHFAAHRGGGQRPRSHRRARRRWRRFASKDDIPRERAARRRLGTLRAPTRPPPPAPPSTAPPSTRHPPHAHLRPPPHPPAAPPPALIYPPPSTRPTFQGRTPLHNAVAFELWESSQHLVALGSDLAAKDRVRRALARRHYAGTAPTAIATRRHAPSTCRPPTRPPATTRRHHPPPCRRAARRTGTLRSMWRAALGASSSRAGCDTSGRSATG